MSDAERKRGFVLPVAISLMVLLSGYVGAYYAAMQPSIGLEEYRPSAGIDSVSVIVVPEYRLPASQEFAGAFFTPIHWLDRRIRPHVWEPE